MSRMYGIAATLEIEKKWPGTKILVFTVHKTPEYLTAALKAGADGYLLKGLPASNRFNRSKISWMEARLLQNIRDRADPDLSFFSLLLFGLL